MREQGKVQTAYEIYQTAGWKALLFAIYLFIRRRLPWFLRSPWFFDSFRSDYARQHIRYLNEREGLRVAEIGVWEGHHAKILQNQLDVEKMYLIDPYDAYEDYEESKSEVKKMRDAKETAHNKLEPYDNIEWMELYSHQAAQEIDEQLDYVYIDGNHNYDYVKCDIELFYQLVEPGGVIAGDDFTRGWPDVIRAVTEFAGEEGVEVHTEPYGADWWFKKSV